MNKEEKRALEELLHDLKEHNLHYALSYEDKCYEAIINLQQELERYKNIVDKAITFINVFQDEKTLTLDYDDLRHLRGILKGNDFDLMILEDKLKELKGE